MDSVNDFSRTVLPIPDAGRTGLITYDARDPETKYPPITQLRPPKGAPNVLVILIDDAGFGSSSAFGGPCQTPNAEALAAGGLKFNRFHTTALCSPTRQALLTGRNHHSVGMGGITEIATGAPGYSTHPYPFKNLHDGLQRIFDAYGPDRFFWGTDITRMPCTYRQCVTMFTEELPWLKGRDLEKVMGRGLAKWIGWNYKFD